MKAVSIVILGAVLVGGCVSSRPVIWQDFTGQRRTDVALRMDYGTCPLLVQQVQPIPNGPSCTGMCPILNAMTFQQNRTNVLNNCMAAHGWGQ